MSLKLLTPCTAQELDVRERARRFVNEHVRKHAVEDDAKNIFRREFFTELAKQGLTALVISKAYGGQGMPSRCHFACLEELARASAALSITVGVTNLIQGAILKFGTEEQKNAHLKRLASGEWLGAFSLSESGSGSDAASLVTTAKKTQGGYLLNGAKMWCSNGGYADLYMVMARTAPDRTKGISSFLVHKTAKGFRIGKQEKKLGLRASTLTELVFEDCFIPDDHRLGDEGQGLIVALSQLDSGRIGIGTTGLGVTLEAIERVWKFWLKQGELPQAASQIMATYYSRAQALSLLMGEAADARDRQETISVLASQVKLLGSDLAVETASDAITFMGTEGAKQENEVERLLRDAKALQIVEGTNQIQRLVLARAIDSMMKGTKA